MSRGENGVRIRTQKVVPRHRRPTSAGRRRRRAVCLPELDRDSVSDDGNVAYGFPSFSSAGGSMELMAVPKRKVSPHKRGIRNGPKALKPIPVIIHGKSCGRVKLPHFYCCSGD